MFFTFTSYVKLQQAYVNEANKYGPWNLIGYTAPGTAANDGSSSTTNFTYSEATVSESGVTDAVSGAWKANNIATLNDCTPGASGAANWTVSTVAIGSDGQDSYTAAVANTDCKALTPTFDKIGQ